MVRKSLFAVGGLMLLVTLLFGSNASNYIGTAWDEAGQMVSESEPIDFQLKRASKMIRDLDPEIKRNMHLIAKQEVEVDKLQSQLAKVDEQLGKSEGDIVRLRDDLTRGNSNYVYAGQSFTFEQVKADLTRRYDRHTTKESTADKLTAILKARSTALEAARDKLAGMRSAKQQLEVEVVNLQARMELVEVAKTSRDAVNIDDSQLAQTRELIDNISARIGVDEKLVNADTSFVGEINLDAEENRDILDEVTRHFSVTPDAEQIVLD